jgi:TPR repeat protein
MAKATDFYLHAAKFGSLRAERRFTRILNGEKIWYRAAELEELGKIEEAVKLYRRGARLGNLGSMINLASLLDDQISPPKPREAIYWYKRGIKAGDSTAAFNFAMHYRNLRQRRWYVHWMRVAAQMGDSDAKIFIRKLDAEANRSKLSGIRQVRKQD